MDKLNYTTFRILKGLFYLLGSVPRQPAQRLSEMLGRLWYRADNRHRCITLDNLTRAFGREKSRAEIERIARRVFKNIIQIVFEIGWSLHLSPQDFSRYFRIENKLVELKNTPSKRGILILTGHVGNWELMPIISAMTEHTANVLYRPMDYAPLELFFAQNRSRFGARLISKDGSLLRVFKALKRRESVVMLLDQNVGWHKGVFVDFFGRRACTSYGLAFIALKTGAPVVPVFVVRNADGDGFTAEIGPEIPLLRTGDHQKDLEENTQRYNDALEAVIRRHPDQWFWVHRRWKTRPYSPWPRLV
jgi:KDO2-lipid IV(A) lauroyltransferase